MVNIIWFRNDLRTIDNPALSAAVLTKQPIRAVFYVTEEQWLNHNWGANKIGFVLLHVLDLANNLLRLNIPLDIEYCSTFTDLSPSLLEYAKKNNCSNLFYNHEYELNESQRDLTVAKLFDRHNIKIHAYHDQTLIKPGVILTKQKTPYNVFTPFKKACYEYLYNNSPVLIAEPKPIKSITTVAKSNLDKKYHHYLHNDILKPWGIGQKYAMKLLTQFCNNNIKHYQQQRDFPALDGTSSLSPYLSIGAISVKQCFTMAINNNHQEFAGGNPGVSCWISELIWRDFYKNIIVNYPQLCKGKNFNTKYDRLAWLNPKANLEKWQNGKTGIPIIDAAMRQLVATGWMHNRLRMITAMFLTKNLLIDWRLGEKFFSQHLIDLDFASNNGGWQWSASTGTDAVPYFRIFNPISQSEKFDPQGVFIKKYCPELKNLNSKQIHNPSNTLNQEQLNTLKYPTLIIDISKSRLRAIEQFKNL